MTAESFSLNVDVGTSPPSDVVPNEHPTLAAPYRIAIVGEAPGEQEVLERRPFVGASGRFLHVLLSSAGINRAACLIANVCQHRPPNNDITKFSPTGPEFTFGRAALAKDIQAFQPNLCLLLGNTALSVASGLDRRLSDWRGSLFRADAADSPLLGRKCLATYHPAAVLRQYDWMPILQFDLRKACAEGASPDLIVLPRTIQLDLSPDAIVRYLDAAPPGSRFACDIEGGLGSGIPCISVAESATSVIVIDFTKLSPDAEAAVLLALGRFFARTDITTIWQNGLYDMFVMFRLWRIVVRNRLEDTMLKHWEKYCELEKGLGFLCSIYTTLPFYKDGRESRDWRTFLEYCGKDSLVTYEVADALDNHPQHRLAAAGERTHYDFNRRLLPALLYMEQRGMLYDKAKADALVAELQPQVYALQAALDARAERPLPFNCPTTALSWLNANICYKRSPAPSLAVLPMHVLKPYFSDAARIAALCSLLPNLDDGQRGELGQLLGTSLNVNSTAAGGDMQWFLYQWLALPPQWKKERGRKTNKLATDVGALLNIYLATGNEDVRDILRIRALETRIENLSKRVDSDGRMRCAYNLVGTETGRLTCYESPTGSGFNLQTVTRKDRCLFIADV